MGLARQLATTWNTVWSHIKPCLQAASDDPARFAGGRVLGVDEHVWHHQDRRRRGPYALTGIVDLTRGKDHPTARLLDLVPGRSGTVHENWLEERGEGFRAGVRIATLDPFQGQQECHRLACSKTQPACSTLSISSRSLAMPQVRYVVASSKKRWVTADARATPLPRSAISYAPRAAGSPRANKNASVRPSQQMRGTSVSKSPTTAPSKSETSSTKPPPPKADAWPHTSSSAYQPAPSLRSLAWAGPYASGRTHSTPTSIQPEPATHPTKAINRRHRTRQTHRQKLPQPHRLPTPKNPITNLQTATRKLLMPNDTARRPRGVRACRSVGRTDSSLKYPRNVVYFGSLHVPTPRQKRHDEYSTLQHSNEWKRTLST